MSRSFADAVLGQGPSVAGQSSEAADDCSGKANPLDAILRCPKTLPAVPVLQALISRSGPDAIFCLRSTSATNYTVTCRSELDLAVLVSDPSLEIDNVRCSISRAGEPLRSVTLRNVPYDATEDDLRQILQPYATLLAWSHETYKDFPGIANGNRRLHIKMPKPLPNFLTFRNKRVIVSYNGVQLLCFRCGSPDHAKKDCDRMPAVSETLTPVDTHASSDAKTNDDLVDPADIDAQTNPQPEKKVSKRKKAAASPAPSRSPSPRSRKKQNSIKSPAVFNAGNARSTTPPSSPGAPTPVVKTGTSANIPTASASGTEERTFYDRVLKTYFLSSKAGVRFRPGICARWIRTWCQQCWTTIDEFRPKECTSSPECFARYVSMMPTSNGMHLFELSFDNQVTFCVLDVQQSSLRIGQLTPRMVCHYGPTVAAYSSAPEKETLVPAHSEKT